MDTFQGLNQDPRSLHKYIFCHGDGINFGDPTGHNEGGIGGLSVSMGMQFALRGMVNMAVSSAIKGATCTLLHQKFEYGMGEFAWDFAAGGLVGIGNDKLAKIMGEVGSGTVMRIAFYGGKSAGQGLIAASEWAFKKEALEGGWPTPESFVRVWAGASIVSASEKGSGHRSVHFFDFLLPFFKTSEGSAVSGTPSISDAALAEVASISEPPFA